LNKKLTCYPHQQIGKAAEAARAQRRAGPRGRAGRLWIALACFDQIWSGVIKIVTAEVGTIAAS